MVALRKVLLLETNRGKEREGETQRERVFTCSAFAHRHQKQWYGM
jgi:hypothetical protein